MKGFSLAHNLKVLSIMAKKFLRQMLEESDHISFVVRNQSATDALF